VNHGFEPPKKTDVKSWNNLKANWRNNTWKLRPEIQSYDAFMRFKMATDVADLRPCQKRRDRGLSGVYKPFTADAILQQELQIYEEAY
jgi:hypothetical protein